MTDLARFQDDLRKQGYVQVPKSELREKTYAIQDTDVLVVNKEYVDRYVFSQGGKTMGVKMKDYKLRKKEFSLEREE